MLVEIPICWGAMITSTSRISDDAAIRALAAMTGDTLASAASIRVPAIFQLPGQ